MAATVLRKRLDEILAVDPKADFVLVGDFNDEPDNVSIAKFLRVAKTPEKAVDGTLYDTTAHLAAEGKGTLVYDDRWELIDHIIISPGLLHGNSFTWKSGSSQRLEFPELFFHLRARSDSPALKELLGKQLSQGRLFRPSGRVVHHQRLMSRVPESGSQSNGRGALQWAWPWVEWPMFLRIACPGCKAVLQVEQLAGKQGKCIHCGHKIVVPSQSGPAHSTPVRRRAGAVSHRGLARGDDP